MTDENTRLMFIAAGLSELFCRPKESLKEGKGGKEVILSELLSPDKRWL